MSDARYADKANSRKGGVGDETVIISSEVYGKMKQEKFIPIVAEYDEEGNPCIPAYIKSRIYIDLSNPDSYESEYEKLLRNIYNKPIYSKPSLGKKPEWLDEEKTNFFLVRDLIKQIKGAQDDRKTEMLIRRFKTEYIEVLKSYYMKNVKDGRQVYGTFIEMKVVRDIFLDFIEAMNYSCPDYADKLCEIFEDLYNTLTCVRSFEPNASSSSEVDFDVYKIHTWELFICTTAYLRHIQDYRAINRLLTNTYFIIESIFAKNNKLYNISTL